VSMIRNNNSLVPYDHFEKLYTRASDCYCTTTPRQLSTPEATCWPFNTINRLEKSTFPKRSGRSVSGRTAGVAVRVMGDFLTSGDGATVGDKVLVGKGAARVSVAGGDRTDPEYMRAKQQLLLMT